MRCRTIRTRGGGSSSNSWGLDENSEVELAVAGDELVITPVRATEREKKFRDAVEKIDRKYENVFRRLADS